MMAKPCIPKGTRDFSVEEMAIGAAYWRKLFRVSSGEDGSEAKL